MFTKYTSPVTEPTVTIDNELPEKYNKLISNYSDFMNTYSEYNSTTKDTNRHIDTLLDSYISLSNVKENIKQYGLTDQFKSFILPDLKGTSLEYTINSNNINEFNVGLEAMLDTLKTKIINALNFLYKKVMEFIEWIATSAVVLRERISFAFNRYNTYDSRSDITKVPHHGVWSQTNMVNIVQKTREFKYKLDTIKIDGTDKFNWVVPYEVEEFYNELKGYTEETKNADMYPKFKRLGDAGFRTIKNVQNKQLANVAYDAVANIVAFRNIYNKLQITVKTLQKRLSHPRTEEDKDPESIRGLNESVTSLKEYYNVCKLIIDLNVSVITQYCSLLKHYNSYLNGNYPEATDDVQPAPAQ